MNSPQGTCPWSGVPLMAVCPQTWRCFQPRHLPAACSSSQTKNQLSRCSEPSESPAGSPESQGGEGRWGQFRKEPGDGVAVVGGFCMLLCSPACPVPHSSHGPPGTLSNVCRSLCRNGVWCQYPPVWKARQQETHSLLTTDCFLKSLAMLLYVK